MGAICCGTSDQYIPDEVRYLSFLVRREFQIDIADLILKKHAQEYSRPQTQRHGSAYIPPPATMAYAVPPVENIDSSKSPPLSEEEKAARRKLQADAAIARSKQFSQGMKIKSHAQEMIINWRFGIPWYRRRR